MILDYQRPGIPDYTRDGLPETGGRSGRWILAPLFIGALFYLRFGSITGRTQCTKVDAAKMDVAVLVEALEFFRADVGQYPDDEDGLDALRAPPASSPGWHGPYVRRGVPLDPWGSAYLYHAGRPSGTKAYTVLSPGADRTEGTADDVVNR